MGMEKEKPYKCEVCQKRYKNLNGLKYHKTHSPPCNPDLPINGGAGVRPPGSALGTLLPNNMGNLGAGLSGNIGMA
jgi:transcription factor SFP1